MGDWGFGLQITLDYIRIGKKVWRLVGGDEARPPRLRPMGLVMLMMLGAGPVRARVSSDELPTFTLGAYLPDHSMLCVFV